MRDRLHIVFLLAGLLLVIVAGALLRSSGPARVFQGPVAVFEMQATAYSLDGLTRSGVPAQTGLVAADTEVLPLGTRIRVKESGALAGEYIVGDTGRSIRGNRIDIYVERTREAREFGRKDVVVEVLAWGDGAASVHEHFQTDN